MHVHVCIQHKCIICKDPAGNFTLQQDLWWPGHLQFVAEVEYVRYVCSCICSWYLWLLGFILEIEITTVYNTHVYIYSAEYYSSWIKDIPLGWHSEKTSGFVCSRKDIRIWCLHVAACMKLLCLTTEVCIPSKRYCIATCISIWCHIDSW